VLRCPSGVCSQSFRICGEGPIGGKQSSVATRHDAVFIS